MSLVLLSCFLPLKQSKTFCLTTELCLQLGDQPYCWECDMMALLPGGYCAYFDSNCWIMGGKGKISSILIQVNGLYQHLTTHKSPRWWPLLFERELVGEVGEESKRCRSPYPSLTNRPLISIFTGQLQLNGHQYTARAVHPSYPQLLCFSDYGLLLPPLLRLGLHQVYGLKQPAGKPAPALLRILFLILAWLLFLLFWNGWLHLGGVSGRHRALWGRRKRGLGGKQGRRVTSGGKECDRKKVRWVIRDERWG